MSKTIDDGGPAFPCEGGPDSGLHPHTGMTLRDYFAGVALQTILGDTSGRSAVHKLAESDGVSALGFAAQAAYETADAMLATRAKGVRS